MFAFNKIVLHGIHSELTSSTFSVKHMMHFISFRLLQCCIKRSLLKNVYLVVRTLHI